MYSCSFFFFLLPDNKFPPEEIIAPAEKEIYAGGGDRLYDR